MNETKNETKNETRIVIVLTVVTAVMFLGSMMMAVAAVAPLGGGS